MRPEAGLRGICRRGWSRGRESIAAVIIQHGQCRSQLTPDPVVCDPSCGTGVRSPPTERHRGRSL